MEVGKSKIKVVSDSVYGESLGLQIDTLQLYPFMVGYKWLEQETEISLISFSFYKDINPIKISPSCQCKAE